MIAISSLTVRVVAMYFKLRGNLSAAIKMVCEDSHWLHLRVPPAMSCHDVLMITDDLDELFIMLAIASSYSGKRSSNIHPQKTNIVCKRCVARRAIFVLGFNDTLTLVVVSQGREKRDRRDEREGQGGKEQE